jgi:hypothetical protein
MSFNFQNLSYLSLPAPLFTGRFSSSIERRNPICLTRDLDSTLLPGIAFNLQNLTCLSLSAPLYTGRFSSSIERRKTDLLWPSFGFLALTRASGHISKLKRPEFARTAFHWKVFFQD